MNIYQVYPYYPPHLGGAELRIKDLADKLTKKGHTVFVITSNQGVSDNVHQNDYEAKVSYLSSFEIANTPIIPDLLRYLLFIPRDSIIHVHIAQIYTPEIVWIFSKIRGIPYIAHIRIDIQKSSFWGNLIELYKMLILKHVLQDAFAVIVPTKDYDRLMRLKYSLTNTTVIPNGIDYSLYKNNRQYNHLSSINILFVGRLTKQKNIPMLLETFSKINSAKKNTKLHIVGEGYMQKYILEYVKSNNLANKIIMHGRKEGNQLISIYKKSDIFLSTTLQESFGNVYIEAMASGLPIVTSNVIGVKNVVINNRNGLLVNQNTNEYSEAVLRILNNTILYRQLSINNFMDAKKYSWDEVICKIENLYQKMATLANVKGSN